MKITKPKRIHHKLGLGSDTTWRKNFVLAKNKYEHLNTYASYKHFKVGMHPKTIHKTHDFQSLVYGEPK